jgi:hypothetical protein
MTVHYYIAVVNTGNDTLHMSSIGSTNPDFAVATTSLVLAPDDYQYVRIDYTSGGSDISDSTSILVASDDDDESLIEIPLTIQVTDLAGTDDIEPYVSGFGLRQNRPNPFDSRTTIVFELDRQCVVDLSIYTIRGRLINRVISHTSMPPGRHQVVLAGETLPSGVYYYRLAAGSRTQTKRMVVLSR